MVESDRPKSNHPAAAILEAADGRDDEDDKDPAPDLIEVEDDNDEAAEESVEAEWSTSRHLFILYGNWSRTAELKTWVHCLNWDATVSQKTEEFQVLLADTLWSGHWNEIYCLDYEVK